MRRPLVLTVVFPIILAGCQTGIPGAEEASSAQGMVTPEVREACPTLSDELIGSQISEVLADRGQGFSENDELEAATEWCAEGCTSQCLQQADCTPEKEAQCEATCLSCWSAVIDRVYR